ncbi:hypothetical protein BpHYR1_053614 [Brachionus plicatilis]|uniref:Uncharacterized protein n=1 Tax=Brachionus plicatilis TaxID=10195 RepID=A0A3M7PI91_BRAPC|nr:hypothetical protein BpHYR1_053614 [Brachionus plicatilis]
MNSSQFWFQIYFRLRRISDVSLLKATFREEPLDFWKKKNYKGTQCFWLEINVVQAECFRNNNYSISFEITNNIYSLIMSLYYINIYVIPNTFIHSPFNSSTIGLNAPLAQRRYLKRSTSSNASSESSSTTVSCSSLSTTNTATTSLSLVLNGTPTKKCPSSCGKLDEKKVFNFSDSLVDDYLKQQQEAQLSAQQQVFNRPITRSITNHNNKLVEFRKEEDETVRDEEQTECVQLQPPALKRLKRFIFLPKKGFCEAQYKRTEQSGGIYYTIKYLKFIIKKLSLLNLGGTKFVSVDTFCRTIFRLIIFDFILCSKIHNDNFLMINFKYLMMKLSPKFDQHNENDYSSSSNEAQIKDIWFSSLTN